MSGYEIRMASTDLMCLRQIELEYIKYLGISSQAWAILFILIEYALRASLIPAAVQEELVVIDFEEIAQRTFIESTADRFKFYNR